MIKNGPFFSNFLTKVQLIGKFKKHTENDAGTVFFDLILRETGPSIICIWIFFEPIW